MFKFLFYLKQDIILILNAIFVVYESVLDLNSEKLKTKQYEKSEHFKQGITILFALVYVTEVFLKLLVFSWDAYWSRKQNRYYNDSITCLII